MTWATGYNGTGVAATIVADAGGAPQPGATVKLWLDVDDFTRAHRGQATRDAAGRASFVVPRAALA